MTAQIAGTEIKLIWRRSVYHYSPVNAANTILNRMQVFLVLGDSSKYLSSSVLMWEPESIFKPMWWT